MNTINNESIKELGKHFELSVIDLLPNEKLVEMTRKAISYNLRAVYVPAFQLDIVRGVLKDSDILLGSAISFPLGVDTVESKVATAADLVKKGVGCIDFVMNHWALRNGMKEVVEDEVRQIRKTAPQTELKMILEVCYLDNEQIKTAIKIAADNKIDVIKSSTGQFQGPTMEQACLIVDEGKKYNLHTKVAGVKFPRAQNAYAFLKAGIDYIGTQQAFSILDGIDLLRERDIM